MIVEFLPTSLRPRPHHVPKTNDCGIRLTKASVLISLTCLLLLALSTLLFGTLIVARLGPVPRLLDLPQQFLPANPPPKDLRCSGYDEPQQYWYDSFCWVVYQGQPIYFEFDRDHRRIIRSIIPAQDYTLGQLIVSWGKPTGINWNKHTAYIYWPSRWAILEKAALRPHSPVHTILFTVDQPPASPWRGFRPTQRQTNLEPA
jgi:hypothetical protein